MSPAILCNQWLHLLFGRDYEQIIFTLLFYMLCAVCTTFESPSRFE